MLVTYDPRAFSKVTKNTTICSSFLTYLINSDNKIGSDGANELGAEIARCQKLASLRLNLL